MTELSNLKRLESQSIHIFREVAAEFERPVLMYSIGKDSAVLLHLAMKAFHPGRIPFPLLHIDTTWKFCEMIAFRDALVADHELDLIVHTNADGLANGINPFDSGSSVHTDVMKTDALKQALDQHQFDCAIGGARRDEEKSRAKERVMSFRNASHNWEPKRQRPELWNLYNCRVEPGESVRAFPLSNWTELDIWTYIKSEEIPIVPLYFAKERPVVERDGQLLMIDDDRFPLQDGETPKMKMVRFRTLGCYPLTAAIPSTAMTIEDIIMETQVTRTSERQGRMIDHDQSGSMEKKKRAGYF
jgi:sulfate adenylyltransferase subunit 2